MAYAENGIYQIVSNRGNGPALSVYGNTQVSDNRNVIVWSRQIINDQKWQVTFLRDANKVILGAFLRSVIQTTYGLNIWRGSTNTNNCDIYPVSGNTNDALLDFLTIDASQNLYRIKLVNHNLYLTATGTSDGADVRWQALNSSSNLQVWKFDVPSNGGGGDITTGILSKDTMPPTATASTPYIINNIPDKISGIDNGVEYHPGCGFANGLNFNTSSDGSAVKTALRAFARKVFNINYDMADKDLCFYMYGERIANGAGQQFHPGVDISYGLGKPIRALFGGTITHADRNIGAVCIQVPTQNNVNMNYLHMQDIVKTTGNVVAGEIIGYQGWKGLSNANATHLHFEVRQNGSPYPVLGPTSPSVAMNTIKPYGYMQG